MILIVLVTSLFQQKQIQGRQSQAAMPPQQQMMMKLIPYMLPVFSYVMPAAVVVYFIISNMVRIAQQAYITRSFYRGEDSLGAQVAKQRAASAGETATEPETKQRSPKSITERKGAPTPKRDAGPVKGKAPARRRGGGGRGAGRLLLAAGRQLPRQTGILLAAGTRAPSRGRLLLAAGRRGSGRGKAPARGRDGAGADGRARERSTGLGEDFGRENRKGSGARPHCQSDWQRTHHAARIGPEAEQPEPQSQQEEETLTLVSHTKGVHSKMEWLEITAASVESAKEQALIHLGVHESDAEFEVLSEERVGMFGRVRQEARVRARVIPTPVRPKEGRGRGHNSRKAGSGSSKRSEGARPSAAASPEPPPDARESQRSAARSTPRSQPSTDEAKNPRQQRGSNDKKKEEPLMNHDTGPTLLEQADLAESFVKGVADTLGVPLAFKRHDLVDGILRIEANGEDIGLLVGRRGATAHAVDELVRTVLQRSGGSTREGKIRMDVGGIRARRAAALAQFTRKVAQEAVESGSRNRSRAHESRRPKDHSRRGHQHRSSRES